MVVISTSAIGMLCVFIQLLESAVSFLALLVSHFVLFLFLPQLYVHNISNVTLECLTDPNNDFHRYGLILI